MSGQLVEAVGLEPTRSNDQRILSAQRIPIPPCLQTWDLHNSDKSADAQALVRQILADLPAVAMPG